MSYRGILPSVIYGFAAIMFIVLSFSFVASLFLVFTSFTEASISWLVLLASFIALFIGGMISGARSIQKGWIAGGATGLLYSTITFLIQYLGYNTVFSFEQYLYHVGYVLAAVLGGMIGVNLFGKDA